MKLDAPAAVLVLLFACGGGAGHARPQRASRLGEGDIEAWDGGGARPPESQRVRRGDPGDAPRSRRHRADGRDSFRTHLIDARFDDADIHNVLRFLADEAGLSLVIGDGVSGRVNDRLVRVDAYEALLDLARAHGAAVERRGRVVIVRAGP